MLPASKIPPLQTELHTSNRILSSNAGSRVTLKGEGGHLEKTLSKALRTQALTALTGHFGLVGLVQYAW